MANLVQHNQGSISELTQAPTQAKQLLVESIVVHVQ